MNSREIGSLAEQKATTYLLSNGYSVIANNFSYRSGEIDIIAQDNDNTICFIEVKSAFSHNWGDPVYNVTVKKQKQIGKAAEVWLAQNGIKDTSCRFDVVTIRGNTVNHYKNAFMLNNQFFTWS